MDLDLPGLDHPDRKAVREWLEENPAPSGRELARPADADGVHRPADAGALELVVDEEIWCQLFSELQAGSDLANLGTRTVRDGHGQHIMELAEDRAGTGDVQRNIIGDRVLGLPHDVDVEQGLSWAEARRR